jgi:transcriptional regulator with XRE-family HTH domain
MILDNPPAASAAEAINHRIAERVRQLRAERGLSLEALAGLSGVSRSMISLIERGESSPTAVVLDRLAAGFGLTLSALFEAAPEKLPASPLMRRKQQAVWRDPATGYQRRNLSPPGVGGPMQLAEVTFPAGARVAYETVSRQVRVQQHLWMLEGAMEVTVGGDPPQRLETGDCLAMELAAPMIFRNPTRKPARYLIANFAEPRGS